MDGKPLKPNKNHAAGANERQDAYLYGHPGGRKKRFRSPAEFFPHLLWLATDATGDSGNCSCKFCSPDELESDEKPPPKFLGKESKQDSKDLEVRTKSTGKPIPYDQKLQRRPSQQTPQPHNVYPSPLPPFRSQEHKLDAQYNKFFYRLGEVVWFSRGAAWGLGVITTRDTPQNYSLHHQYSIQPLSHPFGHPSTITCLQDHLRPWLAWSPPPCTCSDLNPNPINHNRVYTYDTVDWQGVLNGRFGQGDAEVDGSIMAAKAVETTFTLFDPINIKVPSVSGITTQYNGIYLGGEKIWVGEPLRLRSTTVATDIAILHFIIERPNSSDPAHPAVILIGDTSTYRIAQLEPDAVLKDDSHLPLRIREDLRFRNSITMQHVNPARNFTSFWRLQIKAARLELSDIRGRWYESSLLLPLLDEAGYTSARSQGEIGDAGLWMNGQGDCNRPVAGTEDAGKVTRLFRPADTKMMRREDAFGRSVPASFQIGKGLDQVPKEVASGSRDVELDDQKYLPHPSAPETQDSIHDHPTQHQQQQHSYPTGASGLPYVLAPPVQEGGLDQYMKFDDEEGDPGNTALPGFGQNYSSQELDHAFFDNDAM